jgi:microcystin-dependent protein
MPLNGSGTYSLPSPSFPAVANTLITASDFNTTLNDIAAALSQAVFRDGQAAFTASQSMGNQKITSLAAGTATTDAVNKGQLLTLFPIGAVYITATNTNPGTFIGGTWSQIAQGRALIGAGTLGADTYAAGDVGGSARVTLTTAEIPSHAHGGATGTNSVDHTHSGTTASAGSHTHTADTYGRTSFDTTGGALFPGMDSPTGGTADTATTNSAGAHTHTFTTGGGSASHTHTISAQGGGSAHENRMPYLAVYFWQRTA